MSNGRFDTMPTYGQPLPYTQAIAAVLDELRGKENTPENRQHAYGRISDAAGAALLREADSKGWSATEMDAHLAEILGDTTAAEGDLSGGVPTFWK